MRHTRAGKSRLRDRAIEIRARAQLMLDLVPLLVAWGLEASDEDLRRVIAELEKRIRNPRTFAAPKAGVRRTATAKRSKG